MSAIPISLVAYNFSLLQYWFLLPVGVCIAVLVMSAGVSGATLWVPVYLLWLRLGAPLAFWLGLFTMLFGFGSGVYRNWRDGTYDGPLVKRFLAASTPAAFIGGWCASLINDKLLIGLFGIFLLVYGGAIAARTLRNTIPAGRRDSIAYPVAIAGGALTGLISIGVGILAMPLVLRHRSIRTPGEAIGSLVMIIFFTSLAATVGHLRPSFVADLRRELPHLVAILLWAADYQDQESDFVANAGTVDKNGRPSVQIPPRKAALDDLPRWMAQLHRVGFFRAVAGALDCLGAAVVGVVLPFRFEFSKPTFIGGKANGVIHRPFFQRLVQLRLGKGRIGAENHLSVSNSNSGGSWGLK